MPRARQLELDHGRSWRGGGNRFAGNSLLTEIRSSKYRKLTTLHGRGAILFSEGHEARGVYVLQSGRAKLSISSSEGRVLILRIAEPGALLGVNAVIKGSPYDTTVETLEPCCTDFLSRASFLDLLSSSRLAPIGLANVLSSELPEVVDHARSLVLPKSAIERLARLLIKWGDELGEGGLDGTRMPLRLTHEEIAQMICASRETVTRLFAELRRKRILRLAGNAILVRDRKALESLVCR